MKILKWRMRCECEHCDIREYTRRGGKPERNRVPAKLSDEFNTSAKLPQSA